MKLGTYQIGRYHSIIKKTYEDGSIDYETSFTDQADLMQSVYAVEKCIGQTVGIASDHPKVLTGVSVIRGKDNISIELEKA